MRASTSSSATPPRVGAGLVQQKVPQRPASLGGRAAKPHRDPAAELVAVRRGRKGETTGSQNVRRGGSSREGIEESERRVLERGDVHDADADVRQEGDDLGSLLAQDRPERSRSEGWLPGERYHDRTVRGVTSTLPHSLVLFQVWC